MKQKLFKKTNQEKVRQLNKAKQEQKMQVNELIGEERFITTIMIEHKS